MPNRLLREGIIESERVNALSPEAELFYRRLMSKADDYGRFHGSPTLLLAALYPLQLDRVSRANVSEWLTSVSTPPPTADNGGQMPANGGQMPALVTQYVVAGKKYIQINDFGQRTRSDSKFPPPTADNRGQMSADCGQMSADCGQMSADCGQMSADVRSRATSPTTHTTTHTTPTPAARETEFPSPPLLAQTEWPLTTAELIRHDPAVDQRFVLRLTNSTAQALISAGDMEPFDDDDMATAIRESYEGYSGKRAHGNGLLLSRVPQIMLNWGKNGTQDEQA